MGRFGGRSSHSVLVLFRFFFSSFFEEKMRLGGGGLQTTSFLLEFFLDLLSFPFLSSIPFLYVCWRNTMAFLGHFNNIDRPDRDRYIQPQLNHDLGQSQRRRKKNVKRPHHFKTPRV